MTATPEMISLAKVRIDGDTQARVSLSEETVADYAERYAAGAELPPVSVVFDGRDRWLWDGFHRYFGRKKAGLSHVLAVVTPGTRDEARWLAAGANKTNALRRTNLDKRRAVELALSLRPEMSNSAIAEHCGVSHTLVADVRGPLEDSSSGPRTRTGRDGRPINTANIGKAQASPPPATPPPDARNGRKARRNGKAETPTPRREDGEGVPDAAGDEPPLDEAGRPVPAQAAEAWALLPDLRALCRALDEANREAERLGKSPLGLHLHWQSVQSHLKSARSALWQARPSHVCPYCAGERAECRACKGAGWVTPLLFKAAPQKNGGGRA